DLPANTNAQAPRYDPARMPLETMVERRRMRPATADDASLLTFAVEAGLQFLRMVELQAPSKSYRNALIAKFALQPLQGAGATAAEGATGRCRRGGPARAPGAGLRAAASRPAGGIAKGVQDATRATAVVARPKVQPAATSGLPGYEGLFAEPAGPADEAW